MKTIKKFIACVALSTIALPSFAQDMANPKPEEKPAASKPSESEMMTMMMDLAKTNENHMLLKGFVGSWTYKTRYWMNPDPSAPPTEFSGKAVTKPVMGGRYFQSEVASKMPMPGPDGKMTVFEFKGMELDGYDNAKKKFVSSWIDNMGTGIMQSEGTYDPATKTLNYTAEYMPMPGVTTKVRQALTITDNDHHTFAFYEMRGGKEVKTMEIIYSRKS